MSSSILGSDNTIIGSRRTVVLGSSNKIKGANGVTDVGFNSIKGSEINILGTDNIIAVRDGDIKNVAIFGSNFRLATQDQAINAYYIGNPLPEQVGDGAQILSRLFVAADGGAYFTGDVITFALSDQKYKNKVAPLENPLERISKITGVSFEWKDNQQIYSGSDVGVIAQEVEKVLPEVVEDRITGKAVKYEKITPLLIEGIKAQQGIIRSLEERIERLESAIDKLK